MRARVIGVAIAAVSPGSRARLEALVAGQPGLRLVPAAWPGDTAPVDPARAPIGADVLLLESGGRGAEHLLRSRPRPAGWPAVVVLADAVGPADVARLMAAGVRAVLPAEASADEISAGIAAAAAGLVVMHPAFSPVGAAGRRRALEPRAARGRGAPGDIEPLTPREREVLAMIAEGMGNRAIARRLGISTHTVKFHIGAILSKLNARTRTEAVTTGLRLGLLMV